MNISVQSPSFPHHLLPFISLLVFVLPSFSLEQPLSPSLTINSLDDLCCSSASPHFHLFVSPRPNSHAVSSLFGYATFFFHLPFILSYHEHCNLETRAEFWTVHTYRSVSVAMCVSVSVSVCGEVVVPEILTLIIKTNTYFLKLRFSFDHHEERAQFNSSIF